MPTMKAIRIHEHGGPEVLRFEDAPVPNPGKGEVRIKVHAVGVNPVDWKVRDGYGKERFNRKYPFIPGWDVAGVIETVGPGATRFSVGDEVFGYTNLARDGAYAQYVVAAETELAKKPKKLDFVQSASVPVGALTAWQAMEMAQLAAEQTILIHAAAGGVGMFAVQIANHMGAKVIGTASTRNAEFVRSLGVDQFIDYTAEPFERQVKDVDVVFDTVGDDTQRRSFEVLKKNGFLVSLVSDPSAELAEKSEVGVGLARVRPNHLQLETIALMLDRGKLKTEIQTVLPLEKAAEAHELSQTLHVRGKIVLKVD